MAAWMGKDVKSKKAKGGGKWKYLSEKEMLEGAEQFRPYRYVFVFILGCEREEEAGGDERRVGKEIC
jgi:hypothetical protein